MIAATQAVVLQKNELDEINGLLTALTEAVRLSMAVTSHDMEQSVRQWSMTCQKARDTWAFATFSTESEYCLQRYFSYHLQVLGGFLEQLSRISPEKNEINRPLVDLIVVIERELLGLITHLCRFFYRYLDKSLVAPSIFQRYQIDQYKDQGVQLTMLLRKGPLDSRLKNCLLTYLSSLLFPETHTRFTYQDLFYGELFVQELFPLGSTPDKKELNTGLITKLTELNFNHLEFFLFRTKKIKTNILSRPLNDRSAWLKQELLRLRPVSEEGAPGYDPRFPGIQLMLRDWLREELSVLEARLPEISLGVFTGKKILLDLSVAHLACLLKIFYEERLFPGLSLTDLFKFVADHFSTRRQENISWGGLSKEFYSINQVTAAALRSLFKNALSRIDRQFFPK